MKRILFAAAALLALASCSPSQVAQTQAALSASVTAVQAACKDAQAAGAVARDTVKGGAVATVNTINTYVLAGCGTAQAVAALAADSSSVAWLGEQTGQLKAAAQPAGS
jgi:hypothetical protein